MSIIYVGHNHYDFKDESGKRVIGLTVFALEENKQKKGLTGHEALRLKTVSEFDPKGLVPMGEYEPHYDRYGRLQGLSEC